MSEPSVDHLEQELTDLAVGELLGDDRVRAEAHVASCPACAGELAALRGTLEVLSAASWDAPDVLPVARRAVLQDRASRRWRRVPLPVAAGLAAAVAAASTLAVVGRRAVDVGPLPPPVTAEGTPPTINVPVPPPIPRPARQTSTPMGKEASQSDLDVRRLRVEDERKASEARAKREAHEALRSSGYLGGAADAPQALAESVEVTSDLSTIPPGPVGGVPGGVVGGVAGGTGEDARATLRGRTYQDLSELVRKADTEAAKVAADHAQRDVEQRANALRLQRESRTEDGDVGAYVEIPRDMYYRARRANPFVRTEDDARSTFGLDVDTASYTLARNYLLRGLLPPPAAIRVEEFVNALPQDYTVDRGETFAIHLEAAPSPFAPGRHLLRVGLKAREVRAHERKDAVLTFVIDVSGSMAQENRLGLVKRSLRLLVERLDGHDRIGIVVYGTNGRVVLEPTPVDRRETILAAIDRLVPEGSTNLDQGLDLGYAMAGRAFRHGATNRVILCTDGVANNGVTDARTLADRIRAQATKDITLTALGFGMGNYNDALLQRLADEGEGQYAYIDDDQEAEAFFLRRLTTVLETVALDAKAQVEFEPSRVAEYRLLGYEKRDIADESFRDDSVDAGEINAGHTVTALYELVLRPGRGPIGVARVRYVDPDSRRPREVAASIGNQHLRGAFDAASSGFRLTALQARFAEVLRGTAGRGARLEPVVDALERLDGPTRRRPEVVELAQLVRTAARLMP